MTRLVIRPNTHCHLGSRGLATAFGMALAAASVSTAMAAGPTVGEQVAKNSDCFSCHAIDHKVVGPAFDAVAAKYAGKPGAKTLLMDAVKNGHVGTWGKIPMPAHPQLSQQQLDEVITWVLSLKPAAGTKPAATAAPGKTYTYEVDGKAVLLQFPVYQAGSSKKVTPAVFRGYELFNSYCFRCHGADATGSEYAPDLRRSVLNGMTEAKMTAIAMTGIKAKGMPSWAGFFDPKQLGEIYQYVAGRAYKLVAEGTPPQ
ncbi:MAG: c-type cytochrome [Thiomonas sp.]|nr:c-type cytochrome [Thiomonas sp.]